MSKFLPSLSSSFTNWSIGPRSGSIITYLNLKIRFKFQIKKLTLLGDVKIDKEYGLWDKEDSGACSWIRYSFIKVDLYQYSAYVENNMKQV